ncbi:GNAT family N-acetyltransferase [Ottowia thiooxydans]|uniref:N-acetyltransferase YhbS n=1 Tax=Ottowia thiooxydans TaxID=219182 RepID=A0ABV2Q9P6_9BURK
MDYDHTMQHAQSEPSSIEPKLLEIRPMVVADLDGLMQVQQACYGRDYMESAETYRARLGCQLQCSLVAVHNGVVSAYLAAYRSTFGKVTPLHGHFSESNIQDTLYLHDMAVSPNFSGQGFAQALFASLWERAKHWCPRHSALVAVQGSQAYWANKGYELHAQLTEENAIALRSYGDDAVYMVRPYSP